MKKWSTKMLVTLAMMVAIQVVLCRFLSINAWNMRLGFDFIPMVIVGIMYGALPAGAAGIVSDLIGALLFPSGTFFPGYTVTAFLSAFTFGLLLHKKQTKAPLAVGTGNVQKTQLCLGIAHSLQQGADPRKSGALILPVIGVNVRDGFLASHKSSSFSSIRSF